MRELVLINTAGDTPLTRLLNTLGVTFTRASLEQAVKCPNVSEAEHVLIITEEQLAEARNAARSRNTGLPELFSKFVCALVFPFQGAPSGAQALREWTGGRLEIKRFDPDCVYSVARLGLCGPFAGLQFCPAKAAKDLGLVFENPFLPVEHLVRAGQLSFFTKISLPATELFVAGASAVFDTEAERFGNISAAECFSSLVPLILFLRHSQVACWRSPRQYANVVIDDLNLRPQYGFVKFQELASCVDELGCAVSIGFIPWNFRRTSPKVVELFLSRWPMLSLSIHGCDHTRSEFSTSTAAQAKPPITLSLDRMRDLSARTGLRYDKVMVFPQGEFSSAAMQALRHSQFLGVVNTELMDRQTGRGVRAGELLKPAITSYAGFPLFLRRKADEPIANFALDLCLGKPCLIVTHHDYYQRGLQPLSSLVHALSALTPALAWTSLESIVSKSIWIRADPDRATEARLFSAFTEVAAEDLSGEARFSKAEPLAEQFFRVMVDGQPQACARRNGDLIFRRRINTAKPTAIEVSVSPPDEIPATAQPLKHRARVAARRYLSEFRDNQVAKVSWAKAAWGLTRNLMRKSRTLSAGVRQKS